MNRNMKNHPVLEKQPCLRTPVVLVLVGLFFSLSIVSLGGCGTNGGGASYRQDLVQGEYQIAQKLLDQIFSVYQNYTRESFDSVVSRDFIPIRSEFANTAERGFYAGRIIELHYFLDTVTTNQNLMNVAFHWEKKIATYSGGAIRNLRGNAEYTFQNENGMWRLSQSRGQDPLSTI